MTTVPPDDPRSPAARRAAPRQAILALLGLAAALTAALAWSACSGGRGDDPAIATRLEQRLATIQAARRPATIQAARRPATIQAARRPATIDLREVADLDWEHAYLFEAYTSDQEIDQELGFGWAQHAAPQDDGQLLLVLTRDGRVVRTARWPSRLLIRLDQPGHAGLRIPRSHPVVAVQPAPDPTSGVTGLVLHPT